MDIGKPLAEYGSVNIVHLRDKILLQPESFWGVDQVNRVSLAGDRPGRAVFFYNDIPSFVNRSTLAEAKSGHVNVLRYPERNLFAEVNEVIDLHVRPHFPTCDVMRVQLAELPPGERIRQHRDINILTTVHRLHIPLVTHEDVKFTIAGQNFFLKPGILYDLNNVVPHSVENRSKILRIHLLVDMLPHTLARASYHDSEVEMKTAVSAISEQELSHRFVASR